MSLSTLRKSQPNPTNRSTREDEVGQFNKAAFDCLILQLCATGTCYGSEFSCQRLRTSLIRRSKMIKGPGKGSVAVSDIARALSRLEACLSREQSLLDSSLLGLSKVVNEMARVSSELKKKDPGCVPQFTIPGFLETMLGKEMDFLPLGAFYARVMYPDLLFVVVKLNATSTICIFFAWRIDLHDKRCASFVALMNNTVHDLQFVPAKYFRDAGSRANLVNVPYEDEDELSRESNSGDDSLGASGRARNRAAGAAVRTDLTGSSSGTGRQNKRSNQDTSLSVSAAALLAGSPSKGPLADDNLLQGQDFPNPNVSIDSLAEYCTNLTGVLVSYQVVPVYEIPENCFMTECAPIERVDCVNLPAKPGVSSFAPGK